MRDCTAMSLRERCRRQVRERVCVTARNSCHAPLAIRVLFFPLSFSNKSLPPQLTDGVSAREPNRPVSSSSFGSADEWRYLSFVIRLLSFPERRDARTLARILNTSTREDASPKRTFTRFVSRFLRFPQHRRSRTHRELAVFDFP